MMIVDCHGSYQFVSHVLQYERITLFFKTSGILQDSNNVETIVKLRNPRKSLILKLEII